MTGAMKDAMSEEAGRVADEMSDDLVADIPGKIAGAATLAALRAQGVHLREPVRFHFAEGLARRMATQPAAVQVLLQARLDRALAELSQCAPADAATSAATARQPSHPRGPSLLGALNQEWAARTQGEREPDPAWCDMEDGDDTLKSVRRFGVVWEQIAAERQLADAIQHAPDNAGPLNSHRLIVRAMTRMQALSPDYLRRFLGQMDTLLWLDQLQQPISLKDGKSGRRGAGRARK